jgi:hypothetical protein
MLYSVKKNSVSTYPTPILNCNVLCFLHEEDKTDEQKAVYWIPFQVPLTDYIGKTLEEIDTMVLVKGTEIFNEPGMQPIYAAIEMGVNINTPQIL